MPWVQSPTFLIGLSTIAVVGIGLTAYLSWGGRGALASTSSATGSPEAEVVEPAFVRFDSSEHLDGFDQAYEDEYGDVYELESFEKLQGKKMAQDELREVQQTWSKERSRVEKRITKIKSDLTHRYLYRLERRIDQHSYFKKVDYTICADELPFAFFIQKPPKSDPKYEARVVAKFIPWLRELERVFVSTYVKPLDLKRNKELRCYAIAILPKRGDYDDFSRAVRSHDATMIAAHYEPELHLAVTYEKVFESHRNSERESRGSILHEFVHALQRTYYSGSERMPRALWLVEGLAEYRAGNGHVEVESLVEPELNPLHLQTFTEFAFSNAAPVFVIPLEDLLEMQSLMQVWERASRQAKKFLLVDESGAPLNANERGALAVGLFYSQAALLMHFLHSDRRYRSSVMRYIKQVMAGDSGSAAFQTAFEKRGKSAAAVESAFYDFLRDEYVKRWPDRRLPERRPAPPSTITVRIDSPVRRARAPSVSNGGGDEPARRDDRVDRSALGWVPEDWKTQLAGARCVAERGGLEAALAWLKRIEETARDSGARQAIADERQRLRDVLSLRDEFLQEIAKSKRPRKLQIEDEQYVGRLLEVANDKIRLRVRDVEQEFPLEKLRPVSLLAAARKNDEFLVAAYLMLLSGESETKVAESLRKRVPYREKAALLREAPAFKAMRLNGAAAALLDSLFRARPRDRESANAALDDLKLLVREHEKVEMVRERRGALRSLAGSLLRRCFDPRRRDCLATRGELRKLDDGRIEVTYDFKDRREQADFERSEVLEPLRRELPPLAAGKLSRFEVEPSRGTLTGVGAASCRYKLPLEAPFEIEFELTPDAPFVFYLVLCLDAAGNALLCDYAGNLFVADTGSGMVYEQSPLPPRNPQIKPGSKYRYQLRHDGGQISCEGPFGKSRLSSLGNRKSGHLCFWVHSSGSIEISKLKITGKPDVQGLDSIRERWVGEQLRKIF